MKNKVIIGIIAAVVLVAGAGYYLMQNNKGNAPTAPADSGNQFSAETLAALLADGRSIRCTVSPAPDNGNMSGTFYIADKKARSDSSIISGGQTFSSHMIIDGDTSYTWYDDQATGFKTPAVATNANVSIYSFKETQKMDYRCNTWPTDSTMFDLPANVTFSDSLPPVPTSVPPIPGAARSEGQIE